MNDIERSDLKNLLEGLLEVNDVTVTFTKLDGTTRILRGTRNVERISATTRARASFVQSGTDFSNTHPDLIRIWDVDINDWRSIRIDSITDYAVHLQPEHEVIEQAYTAHT